MLAGGVAFGLLVEPLRLRSKPFQWPFLFAVATKTHFNRRPIRPEIERVLEVVRQIRERLVFVDLKMFPEGAFQLLVIGTHSFGPAPPRRDRALGNRFSFVGDHQFGIDHELRSQTVTGWTRAEMAVERKMFRRELAQRKV